MLGRLYSQDGKSRCGSKDARFAAAMGKNGRPWPSITAKNLLRAAFSCRRTEQRRCSCFFPWPGAGMRKSTLSYTPLAACECAFFHTIPASTPRQWLFRRAACRAAPPRCCGVKISRSHKQALWFALIASLRARAPPSHGRLRRCGQPPARSMPYPAPSRGARFPWLQDARCARFAALPARLGKKGGLC